MKITAYHGTAALFDKFDQSKSRIANDFYGGGVAYFTDNLTIAKQYAAAMSKKTPKKEKVIYRVELNLGKVFDVDEMYSGKPLQKFVGTNAESFARGAGLLSYGVDKFAILSNLKDGNMELNGDKVFKGLSGGMISTAKGRETLKRLGYDGLRYNGGQVMHATPHSVYLVYKANDITIKDVMVE